MNHYLDVVKEQMDLMVDSGLYDVAESISVGCNGDSSRSIDGITRRCLDNTKAKKILEWSPSVSIMEGIESILYNNYLENLKATNDYRCFRVRREPK